MSGNPNLNPNQNESHKRNPPSGPPRRRLSAARPPLLLSLCMSLSLSLPLALPLGSSPAAAAAAAAAPEIRIEHAAASLISEAWYLDAKISFAFHADVIEALNNGVDLNIDIDILIRERRRWLWDKVVKKSVIALKLEYQPLADLYIVTRPPGRERVRFHDLESALRHIGGIDKRRLLDASLTPPGKQYSGRLSAGLNLKHLPPPLRPVAYISSRWRADSDPYLWSFAPAPAGGRHEKQP